MKLIAITSIILLLSSFYSYSGQLQSDNNLMNSIPDTISLEAESYGNIQIYTPANEYYDDGVFKPLYSSYKIYDEDNNLVLSVSKAIDTPPIIKIMQGTYFILFNKYDKAYEIKVPPYQYSIFVIPE